MINQPSFQCEFYFYFTMSYKSTSCAGFSKEIIKKERAEFSTFIRCFLSRHQPIMGNTAIRWQVYHSATLPQLSE